MNYLQLFYGTTKINFDVLLISFWLYTMEKNNILRGKKGVGI